ncbi:MAG TPA: hypothetical protein VGD43_12825 [Micromonospora sp.]
MRLVAKAIASATAAALGIIMGAVPAVGSSLTISSSSCESAEGVRPWVRFSCYAIPSGGNGSYTWSWQSLTQGAYFTSFYQETADGQCYAGYSGPGYSTSVLVTVTSGGESVSRQIGFLCAGDPL